MNLTAIATPVERHPGGSVRREGDQPCRKAPTPEGTYSGPLYKVSDVRHGENHTLLETYGNALTPSLEFNLPESAEREEPAPYRGRLKQRREPEGLRW